MLLTSAFRRGFLLKPGSLPSLAGLSLGVIGGSLGSKLGFGHHGIPGAHEEFARLKKDGLKL